MKQRTFRIYGITVGRVSRSKARNLCKTSDTPVFMTMVNENLNSVYCVPYHMNSLPITESRFDERIAQYTYYNKGPQFGYYPAFYTEVKETKK